MNNSKLLNFVHQSIVDKNPEQGWIVDDLLMCHIGGSQMYGTSTPTSDYDIRGITLAPRNYWVGWRNFEQVERKEIAHGLPGIPDGTKVDIVIYDFRKWLGLALQGNPNVIETLFVNDTNPNVIGGTGRWCEIRERVKKQMSQKAYDSFHGYSLTQIKKMVGKRENKTGRQDLVEQHGFDTKFMMHGFRVAQQGIELLNTGKITFPRPNADTLLKIRQGKTYSGVDGLNRGVADWEAVAAELHVAKENTLLPKSYDPEEYERILMDVFDNWVAF